uniref:Uncharacterized protein n=1 Tax=Noccaea caerulescens TaxID=107243 RepID=A0A1J3D0D3_NOCCA
MDNGNNGGVSVISRVRLDQVATWVSSSVVSAFFTSLERCACLNLDTTDPDDDDSEFEAKDRPLAFSAAPHPSGDIV